MKKRKFEALVKMYVDEWGYHEIIARKLAYDIVYGD